MLLLFISLLMLSSGSMLHALAQTQISPWTTPVNISRSGAASQPVVVAVPDGTLYALWWDAVEGEQYARTTSVTETAWTKPIAVPAILGERQIVTNTQTGRVRVTLVPPREVRALSDSRGNLYTLWYNVENQLLSASLQSAIAGRPTILADAVLSMDAAADLSGTLRLAYVLATGEAREQPGVYYRATTGGEWSAPSLVYGSPYFRTSQPAEAHVSVAGDGRGRTLVVWDDPATKTSVYARSTDGGRTWSAPLPITGAPSSLAVHARVASAPTGEFLMLWQDPGAGCVLSQRRSTDGGQTWSAPERVLTDLARCPAQWQFAPAADGRLWLLGQPTSDTRDSSGAPGTLAAWDGKTWSKPADVRLIVRDTTLNRSISLGCLGLTAAGQSVGLIGCDTTGDVWGARNAIELNQLVPALKPIWSAPESLSDKKSRVTAQDLPALTADTRGKLYALWSQSAAEDQPGTALYLSVWDGSRWGRAAQVLRSPDVPTGHFGEQVVTKSGQPALVADSEGRLHAVWSGGTSGKIFYSWVFARDAASAQGWAEPVALPSITSVGSWPDMLADPRGSMLHVIYAVPYNERRGIYYTRSNEGITAWLTPTIVFDAVAAQWDSVDKPRLALDAKANILHAVWLRTVLPGGLGTQAVMYARSTDGGQTWSAPIQIAEGNVDSPRMAVSGTGQVYVVWNLARTRTEDTVTSYYAEVWGQFSPDGGQRWSEPARVRGFDAVSGPVGLTSDDAGRLYLVGVGVGAGGESALLYTQWDGRAWIAQEATGLGQNVTWGNAAVAIASKSAQRLSVVLRLIVQGTGDGKQFDVMATGREISIASVAAPAPTLTPMPIPAPTITPTPYPTPTPVPPLNPERVARSGTSPLQSQSPLILGGAIAVLVAIGTVVARILWLARH